MNPTDIRLGDLERIMIGEVPAVFFLEVVIRVAFIYLLLMVSMRILGKRMASTLSGSELAALVSLAAAIGVPISAPDRGLLPAAAIALVVIVIQRFISARAYKDQEFEKLSQGDLTILVENGVMQLEQMEKSRITHERVRAQLRSEGLRNMGAVKRLYLEATGGFTIIRNEDPVPGLSLVPKWDMDLLESQIKADNLVVCGTCGDRGATNSKGENCVNCGENNWTTAVKEH